MEEALALQGKACEAPKGSLRWIARQALERAGDSDAAMREVADRFDGKVPQGHQHAGEDGGPIRAITADLSKATNEQLDALESIFGPLATAATDDGGDPEREGET